MGILEAIGVVFGLVLGWWIAQVERRVRQLEEKMADPSTAALMKFFSYAHLPEPQRSISEQFYALAKKIDDDPRVQPSAEKTMGLRKILEGKDCIVRASLKDPDRP